MFYRSVVRQAMTCGSEYLAEDRKIEQRRSVAEIRILRWMSGMTSNNTINN